MARVFRIALVVAAVLGVLAFCAMCGLSERGLEEFEQDQAREAGVSRECYEAIRDSLLRAVSQREQETGQFAPLEDTPHHEDVVRAAQDAQMRTAVCPGGS